MAFTIEATSTPNFESRSKSRKGCGCSSYSHVSRSCSVTHSVLGLRVTLQRKIRRRSWLITKTVQDAEGQGRYCEEIHGGDSFAVVSEKDEPSFRKIGVPGSTFHPSGYAALGDIEAQHEQLAVNAGCAPGRVLGHHPQEQVAYLLAHRFAAGAAQSPRAPSPIPSKAGAMPADNRSGVTTTKGFRQPDHNRRSVTQNSRSREPS